MFLTTLTPKDSFVMKYLLFPSTYQCTQQCPTCTTLATSNRKRKTEGDCYSQFYYCYPLISSRSLELCFIPCCLLLTIDQHTATCYSWFVPHLIDICSRSAFLIITQLDFFGIICSLPHWHLFPFCIPYYYSIVLLRYYLFLTLLTFVLILHPLLLLNWTSSILLINCLLLLFYNWHSA